jgi:hypothetical protein
MDMDTDGTMRQGLAGADDTGGWVSLALDGSMVGPAVQVSVNPVLAIPLMQMSEADFAGCRIKSVTGEISVLDAIDKVKDNQNRPAKRYWERIQTKSCAMGMIRTTTLFQFPGARQRPTPVASFAYLLVILGHMPGPTAARLRAQQADISSRAATGDRALAMAVIDRADVLDDTITMTTSTIIPREHFGARMVDVHKAMANVHCAATDSKHAVLGHDVKDLRVLQSRVTNANRIESQWVRMRTIGFDLFWDDTECKSKAVDTCYSVYCVRMGTTDLVKVGYSADVPRRIRTFQTANPLELSLEFVLSTTHYRRVERQVHDHLKACGQHIRGEWFSLASPVDYMSIMQAATSARGSLKPP